MISQALGSKLMRVDPTRTGLLRKQFISALDKRFNLLKRNIYEKIVLQDALGLGATTNRDVSNEPRDITGKWVKVASGSHRVGDIVKVEQPGKIVAAKKPTQAPIIIPHDPHHGLTGRIIRSGMDNDFHTVQFKNGDVETYHEDELYAPTSQLYKRHKVRKPSKPLTIKEKMKKHAEVMASKLDLWDMYLTPYQARFGPLTNPLHNAYDPDEPRDDHGRWASGNITGWLKPNGEHVAAREMHHPLVLAREMEKDLGISQADTWKSVEVNKGGYNLGYKHGYIRLYSHDPQTEIDWSSNEPAVKKVRNLDAELSYHQLDRFKQWLKKVGFTAQVNATLYDDEGKKVTAQRQFTANFDPDEPRDDEGRWISGPLHKGNVTGWISPKGKHLPLLDEDIGHPDVLVRDLEKHGTTEASLGPNADIFAEGYKRGYIRLYGSRSEDLIHAELVYSELPKLQKWLRHIGYVGDVDATLTDAAGLKVTAVKMLTINQITANTWRFMTSPQKLTAFKLWLQGQIDNIILAKHEHEDESWIMRYIHAGYAKGQGRAFDELRKPALVDTKKMDFYQGTKQEFLKSAFGRYIATDRVKLLASRAYTELEGITDAMSQQLTRELVDGMTQGLSPRTVGTNIAARVDGIGKVRARTLARTETIRAHAEGALDAMEQLGVDQVGVAVEWSTSHLGKTKAGNPSPCKLCAPLDGMVLTIDEARGMFPRHPNCMCSPIPANVGEAQKYQQRTKDRIQSAIQTSLRAGAPKSGKYKPTWAGAKAKISKTRPKSIV